MTSSLDRLAAALADRYTIERELGAGGMATVYLAHDVRHDRKVALKVLRPELAAVLGADRFLSEIKTTANLQHPHILPLHDSGEANEFLFYVMPYVEGETVRDRLGREKQLPIADAVRIATEVASALDYAHRHGVIHRDIKPENILLHDGAALVADFGIALAASKAGDTRMTETGMSLGTPHYMAPEQAMGERDLTPKADIYALGCVLYEMLLGEPPFTGPTAQSIVAKVMTEKPAPLVARWERIPPVVEDAVLTALEKLPADRFGSAAEFAAALGSPAAGAASAARGRRAPVATGWRQGALLAAALAVGVLAGLALRRAPAAAPEPVVRFALPVQLGDIDFGPGLDLSEDGTVLVFIGRAPNGRPGLYRRPLAEGDAVPMLGTQESIVRSPALSPDGRRVAYSSSSQLRVTPIDGGGSQTVADTVSPTSGGIAWLSPDSLVFQRSFGQGLRVVAARGGRSRVLTTVDSGSTADHRWPQALPGGRFVVFTIWSGAYAPARIAVAAVRSGEVRDLLPGAFARYDGSGHLVFVGPGGALQRVAFDAGAARLRGDPAGLADSVSVGGDGAAQFALSRTGTLALIRSVRVVRPVLVDKSGGVTTVRGIAADLYASPRYAPGARQFVVEQLNGDIWVDNFDTQTWSRVTDGGGFYSAWTPDAKRIYFARDEQAEVNIYSVPVDRSEPRRPELVHHGQVRTQDISHDGKYLLLRQNVGTGQYDLLSLALDSGATPTPWLASPSLERAPTFSPDDRWVAYSSDESGREEIYVRPFPGPGGRVPVSVGGGTEPAWSTDGHELYYRSGDSLLAVRVESRAAFRVVSPPRAILRGDYYAYPWARQYDVNPDGRHFLFLRFDTPVTDLTVVVNWVRRLQAP